MPPKQPNPITLTDHERDLILTLRSNKAAETVTVPKPYLELLLCTQRDVAEAAASLSRANGVLAYMSSQTVEEGVIV